MPENFALREMVEIHHVNLRSSKKGGNAYMVGSIVIYMFCIKHHWHHGLVYQ